MGAGPLRVIVLAAQRPGVVDPLAARFGVSHKCLVPLQGRPLIAHVLETAARHPLVDSVAISVEAEAFAAIEAAVPGAARAGAPIRLFAAADNLADSVKAAVGDHDGPLLITTGDHPLLSPASIAAMAAAVARADVALSMARRDAVLAAHPDGQRRFYRFRGGEYSNCNLYGMAGARALDAAEVFRGGGQFAKKASRIVEAFGLINLVLLRLRAISLEGGLRRVSRRIGLCIAPVILEDGTQAIDVDNDRTHRVVSELLEQRRAA
jgi:CTP:molybdopterin cytidylyltransferase MocA